jgi:hypothetical protein
MLAARGDLSFQPTSRSAFGFRTMRARRCRGLAGLVLAARALGPDTKHKATGTVRGTRSALRKKIGKRGNKAEPVVVTPVGGEFIAPSDR